MSDTTPIPPASERELLPCPFCGHDSPEFERMGTSSQSCIVICGNCGARHESGDEYLRSGSSWNTRAALSHPATLVADILKDCCECERPSHWDVETVELRVSDLTVILERHIEGKE